MDATRTIKISLHHVRTEVIKDFQVLPSSQTQVVLAVGRAMLVPIHNHGSFLDPRPYRANNALQQRNLLERSAMEVYCISKLDDRLNFRVRA